MTRRTRGLKRINENPSGYYFQSLVHHATGRYTFVPVGNYDPNPNEIIEVKCPYGMPGDSSWNTGMPPSDGWYYVRGEFNGKAVYLRPCKKQDYGTDSDFITWGWDPSDDPENLSSDGGPTIESIEWKRTGDRLWVRETWSYGCADFGTTRNDLAYKADGKDHDGHKWIPSIHMPRSAARLILEVKNVRVERLQDITEQDAISEGVESWIEERIKSKPAHYRLYYHEPGDDSMYSSAAVDSFQSLWQSINGPESWDANPWVWVIEFERINN